MNQDQTQEPAFSAGDMEESERCATLGPHYFSSRRVVEAAMSALGGEDAKKIAEKIASEIYGKIQEVTEDHLWADCEINLQGKMWHMVDDIVRGILSGERWIMERYALGGRYDCEKVREAVANHIPRKIMDARISDLMAENKRLTEQLEWERRR